MQRLIKIMFCFSLLLVSACASLNPYEGDFSCPQMEEGKCVSVSTAYEESIQKEGEDNKKGDAEIKKMIVKDEKKASSDENLYQSELYKKVASLMKQKETPLVVPAKTIRIWFKPYEGDDGNLYMNRYVYVFVDGPKWILDVKGGNRE